MTRAALTARDRRTLVLGAVGIGALLLMTRGLPAWRGWVAESRAAAVEQHAEAARAGELVRALPTMRDSLAVRNGRFLALAPALLAGGSLNAAGATLASLVSNAATDAGVKIGAVQLRTRETASHPTPAFARIRVETDVTGDIDNISQFLLAIESGPTRLAIRDLTVTQSDAVGAPDRPETLHATLTVEGLGLAASPPAIKKGP